jgi:hypothetical protein
MAFTMALPSSISIDISLHKLPLHTLSHNTANGRTQARHPQSQVKGSPLVKAPVEVVNTRLCLPLHVDVFKIITPLLLLLNREIMPLLFV